MTRQVMLTKTGMRSRVVTESHHRAGYVRIGTYSKVFCSCGWAAELDGVYTEMMAVFEAHKAN